jgi:Domain of unknown function (DUF5606)
MEFKDLLHISGKSGLYEMIGSRSNGVIARSLDDNSTQFFSSRIFQFTPLHSIEMFTHTDNVSLQSVMNSAKEKQTTVPIVDANADATTLKNYFSQVLPDYDQDRVKMSDIKKFIKWFQYCKDLNLQNENDASSIEEQIKG